MAKLLAAIIAVFMISVFIADHVKALEEKQTFQVMTLNEFLEMICRNYGANVPLCSAYSTTTTTTTAASTAAKSSGQPGATTSATAQSTTTPSASALERAHWCRFNNGSYLSLGQTFMHTECALCQCTQSKAIRCTTLQCMTTYCIDNSKPITRSGQCCSQCSYDQAPTACVVNGVSFPHGTILKKTSSNIQCWCQLGNVECRKAAASTFSGLDVWGEGTAVYVVVIIICALLIIGTLTCSAGACFFYYYYKRNQQSTQQAYEHYYNTAGWQPMGEDGVVVDQSAEEKKAEAEQAQYEGEYPTGNSEQYIPPPYALYNGTYLSEQPEKDQRYI